MKNSDDGTVVGHKREFVAMIATPGEGATATTGSDNEAAGGTADWLCLAAAPTFAMMALLTGIFGAPDMLCSGGRGAISLSGMVPMYLLMSAFHSTPWLKLIGGRRRGICRG
jgi:hypothetical protein